jgi:hypothetical protein
MLTAERCRVRAAECLRMAECAPNTRVRDILLDVARTWTRLAFEVEQWSQMNRPTVRLTKIAHKDAPREVAQTSFVEEVNVAIEHRWARGQYDRLSALAADLADRKVAVIAANGGSRSALAATVDKIIAATRAFDGKDTSR